MLTLESTRIGVSRLLVKTTGVMGNTIKGVCIGAGYFSHFHYEAWQRIPDVKITAFSDLDAVKGDEIKRKFNIKKYYQDFREMLLKEKPDFVDVITPPSSHTEICKVAAELGIHIICQKPLTTTYEDAYKLTADVVDRGVRFIIHENFRFQPWHREIKRFIDGGVLGEVHNLFFRSRMGDGWGEDAYLGRQPYFREYKKLLIYETGVHYIDTFRYHAGEPTQVFALLRKLNPIIKGEDCGLMTFTFENGAVAQWDANRYNEHNYEKNRYTFGEYLVEGEKGSVRLYHDGRLTLQQLGEKEKNHPYFHEDRGFAGDCCHEFQRQAIEAILDDIPFETDATEYLKTLYIKEMVYKSSEAKAMLDLSPTIPNAKTLIKQHL